MNDPQEQLKGFSAFEMAKGLNKKEFKLILFPTEQCNLRCIYCYEDFDIGKMPTWLVNATNEFIASKMQHLESLSLSWFGGEPLLAKDIIFDIAEKAQKLSQKYNCKVNGDLTTNGILLDIETLKRLVKLKQNHFQISIDGDEIAHNKTRITRNGRGTFNKIWSRLIAASETTLDFSITVRVHVTDLNQDSVLDFCKRFNNYLSKDPRFKLFFKAIEDLGGNNKKIVNALIKEKGARKFAEELTQKYTNNITKNESGHYICYASKPNSLSIRANGSLNKCTVALNDTRNDIGKINPDGTLTINNQKFSTWIQGFISLDSWQMGCPLGYMNQYSNVGDIQVKKIG